MKPQRSLRPNQRPARRVTPQTLVECANRKLPYSSNSLGEIEIGPQVSDSKAIGLQNSRKLE
jgi:hypothetical protein